ncbi:MAG: uracil-DNA glycosylase [Candidatus Pacebacteria bacterium]|nr:uracil-DNA glycosylase [Candidatus Paceibacterota bacterium]
MSLLKDRLQKLNSKLEASYLDLPLATKASDIIPGEGTVHATVMLIGEAPGALEAIERRPFVGRSGQLLRKVITQLGLDFSDLYISNIIKVRPPENRDPSKKEIESYKLFLDEEIEIIDPLLIITLGRLSMNKFLPKVKISQVHGQIHDIEWNGKMRKILPMYHPAAALRGTKVKNMFIDDFSRVKEYIN